MITFACKSINKTDIVRCTFDLNKTEYNVLDFFFNNSNNFTIGDISKKLRLERTTVQKALKTLMKKKLVEREKENLKNGGYIFFYKITNKRQIKKGIKETISNWYKNAIKSVEDL